MADTLPFGRLDGRRAFVSGAARGIGAAIAKSFVTAGANVLIADLDMAQASEVGRQIGAAAVRLDVSDAGAVQAAVEQHGPFDILVNNAGIDQHAFFIETTPHDWAKLIAVNLTSVLACTHAVLPAMQAARYGRIINITSEAARLGSKGGSVYSAAKGGVIAFTKATAREMARSQVNANCICPGPTDTALFASVGGDNPKLREALTKAIPFRRLAEPTDLANAVAFFASDEAAYITGQTVSVSGGLTMS